MQSNSVYVGVLHNPMGHPDCVNNSLLHIFCFSGASFVAGFEVHFHWQRYKTIGWCFQLCTIVLWYTWEVWRVHKKLEFRLFPRATLWPWQNAMLLPMFPSFAIREEYTLLLETVLPVCQNKVGKCGGHECFWNMFLRFTRTYKALAKWGQIAADTFPRCFKVLPHGKHWFRRQKYVSAS